MWIRFIKDWKNPITGKTIKRGRAANLTSQLCRQLYAEGFGYEPQDPANAELEAQHKAGNTPISLKAKTKLTRRKSSGSRSKVKK